MTIKLLYPAFLGLLLAIPALWFYPRGVGNRTLGVLRSLLAAALIVALARPMLLAADGDAFQVLVLDKSASVGARQRAQADELARRWIARLANKSKAGVVVLGRSDAGVESSETFDGIASVVNLPGEGSSLSAALAAAERQIPDGSLGALTLISDGLSTDRRWGPVVQRLMRRGITVDTAQLGRDDGDVYPAGIYTDEVLRAGQTARVSVRVVGRSNSVQVRLLDAENNQLAASRLMEIAGSASIAVEFEPRASGFTTVRAQVVADGDTNAANNEMSRVLAVQPALRMLYLGERMRGGAARLRELLGGGLEIEDGSDRELKRLDNLASYDLVMVDDRMAARVPESLQKQLAQAVSERGLGLILSGGKAAFGAGGYEETTLARVLPVDLRQKTEKRDPSIALALIVDTSGSMGGNRIELAKQVARLAVRRLQAHDRVGIVEFYGNKHWALPMQPAANRIGIDRAIGRMQANGGTVLYPAIEEAFYSLKNVSARYKHILLVTDAGIEDGNYEALIRRIARDKINFSTVLVGAQAHSAKLIDMAAWGGGRFYSAADRYSLPEVIFKQPSTMKLPAYMRGSFPVRARGAAGWWGDIDRYSLPVLAGYVGTSARPGAEVLLEVAGSSEPVIASWHYGLGRVTALMTEPLGPGTAGWRAWRDYGRLLSRLAQRTADGSQVFRYSLTRDGRVATLGARRYSRNSSLQPAAAILNAQNQPEGSVDFQQLAPDYFVARWTAASSQELRLRASAMEDGGFESPRSQMHLVCAACADIVDERQVDPLRSLDLAALASATGGVRIDPAQPRTEDFRIRAGSEHGSLELHPLWRHVLLLGLLLYLGELIYRRRHRTFP